MMYDGLLHRLTDILSLVSMCIIKHKYTHRNTKAAIITAAAATLRHCNHKPIDPETLSAHVVGLIYPASKTHTHTHTHTHTEKHTHTHTHAHKHTHARTHTHSQITCRIIYLSIWILKNRPGQGLACWPIIPDSWPNLAKRQKNRGDGDYTHTDTHRFPMRNSHH